MTITDVANMLDEYKPMALYFAKNKSLADDVLQDVFIKINRRYERDNSLDFIQYNNELNRSYLFLMIRSCYTDIIRKEKRYTDEKIIETITQPIEPNILEKHLKGLTWYEKKLTEVYFNDGHTIRSLAKATGISKTNIHLTLKKTKMAIKDNIDLEIKNEVSQYVKNKVKNKKNPIRKKKPKSKGVGDTVEKITKATGIKKVVDTLFDDCGCDKRKKLLNKIFPYKNAKCMTEEQYNRWSKVISNIGSNIVKDNELKEIASLHAELFDHKYHEPCRCSPREWKHLIKDIDKIYNTYDN